MMIDVSMQPNQGTHTQNPSDGESLQCQVCYDTSDGLHFGIYSCRACAAFFRRSVSLKLEFSCRAQGNCAILKSARNMCRACRFQKCLTQGMQITAVQLSRDGIGKRRESRDSVKNADERLNLFTHTAPVVANLHGMTLTNPLAFDFIPKWEPMKILSKMHEGYLHFLSIRKATNSLVENESLPQMFQKQETLRMSNFDNSKKVCRIEAHLITDVVNNYFYPFSKLDFPDKVLLFKNFFCYLSNTDRAFQSYKLFGNNENDDRIIMPDGGYIKLSELEKYYENAQAVKASPMDAARLFRPAMTYILDAIITHMKRIQLTDLEFIAILGLFLWNEGVSGITENCKQMIYKSHDDIFHDLHNHYRQLGLDGPAITNKTGQLMLLLPKLTRSVVMFRENFDLAELFNIFEVDVCCKSFSNTDYQ